MITTIWGHRLHKIDDERIGGGIGRKRDENIVKKGLIIFVGPQKTGKNVIHNPERGRVSCIFDERGGSSMIQRDTKGDMTKLLTKSENLSDVVNDVVLHMSITKEGTYG